MTDVSTTGFLGARYRFHSCENHKNNIDRCLLVNPDDVLTRLRRAKETGLDAQLIIVDVREGRLYEDGHILTARSTNCYTKTMAKGAIASWDCSFGDQLGCPCPNTENSGTFCTQISQVTGPSIVIYDQRGDRFPAEMPSDSPVRYFIEALLSRGNVVYFMMGGFEAFQALRSADFIDRGPPVSRMASSYGDMLHPLCSSLSLSQSVTTSKSLRCPLPLRSEFLGSVHVTKSAAQTLVGCPKFSSDLFLNVCNDSTVFDRSVEPNKGDRTREEQEDVLNASVSKILPFLYLGNARDAQDVDLLSRLGVTHIINVTDSLPIGFANFAKFKYLHLQASDTTHQDLLPAFDGAVSFIEEARKSKGTVLVHCLAGVSRSVAIVMAYILYSCPKYTVLNALEFVQSRRPVAGPNLHFMGQLQHYYNALHNPITSSFSAKAAR
ncbi:unnamed protein product [Calicophoron daubneyi]|uniref:protein-tyrosine-phosphatase n=1 Tax=Calicophoron daubneyi TaxID=300641 RepID=A0AAV2T9P7_CALDB